MIRHMMNSNNYAEKLRKMNTIIFVLIYLKREIREDIVCVLKAKDLLCMYSDDDAFSIILKGVFI